MTQTYLSKTNQRNTEGYVLFNIIKIINKQ